MNCYVGVVVNQTEDLECFQETEESYFSPKTSAVMLFNFPFLHKKRMMVVTCPIMPGISLYFCKATRRYYWLFQYNYHHHHHHHHHHLSLNHEGRWGITNDFATSFEHNCKNNLLLGLSVRECVDFRSLQHIHHINPTEVTTSSHCVLTVN